MEQTFSNSAHSLLRPPQLPAAPTLSNTSRQKPAFTALNSPHRQFPGLPNTSSRFLHLFSAVFFFVCFVECFFFYDAIPCPRGNNAVNAFSLCPCRALLVWGCGAMPLHCSPHLLSSSPSPPACLPPQGCHGHCILTGPHPRRQSERGL